MRDSNRSIISVIAQRPARALTCAALAVAFATTPLVSPTAAYAVSAETQAELAAAESQVDQYAAAYDEAASKLDELQQKVDENTASIAEIEAEIPELQAEASQAMRDAYKYQSNSNPLVSFVLKSQSLNDLITSVVYMDEIQSSNNAAIEELNAKEQELQRQKTELDQAKAQLEEQKKAAASALAEAQQARSAAQAKAEAEAAAELAALAAQSTAEQTAPAEGTGESGDNPNSTATQTGQTVTNTVPSGAVNWNLSREEFIAEWTSRINAYLAGSPLAGTGAIFAECSWNTGVDPRWSPAISCIESTKGAHCANSYNAWGMRALGSGWLGFGSWGEAITYHVSYLKRMYGTTLTPAAAKKYCPPTWQDWYNKVSSQMARI